MATTRIKLTTLLHHYEKKYASNPSRLYLSIPKEEQWRFFVDGCVQSSEEQINYLLDTNAGAPLNRLLGMNTTERRKVKKADIERLNRGWLFFEKREPGYLRALYNAFRFVFEPAQPLTQKFICQLHYAATEAVDKTNYSSKDGRRDHFRRNSRESVVLGASNCTYAGLVQMLNEREPYAYIEIDGCMFSSLSFLTMREDHETYYTDEQMDPELYKNLLAATTIEEQASILHDAIVRHVGDIKYISEVNFIDDLEDNCQKALDEYNQNINRLDAPMDKLRCIVKVVQKLEQIHLFIDANCRTYCMILLNHLLAVNGLPLCILPDPNRFDLFSVEELMDDVIRGMQNTFTLIETGQLYYVKTSDVLNLLKVPNSLGIKREHFDVITNSADRLQRRVEAKLRHEENDGASAAKRQRI